MFTLAAPLLFYLIFKTGAVALAGPSAVAPAMLPPADYRPLAKQNARMAYMAGQNLSPEVAEIARKAALSSPLSHEPFLIAAKVAEKEGKLSRARDLLEEARRRRPSHATTRIFLANYYAQAGRPTEALLELDAALRLNEGARAILLPHFSKLMQNRDGREALATVLAAEPAWRQHFLSTAASQKLTPAETIDFFRRISTKKPARRLGPELRFAVQSLASQGEYGLARNLWFEAVPSSRRAENLLIFDGEMKGQAAPPPFGWTFPQSEAGRGEIRRERGQDFLEAVFFGGGKVTLAEQTLVLVPGSYRLTSSAKVADAAGPGRMYWQLSCLPSREVLRTSSLVPPEATTARSSGSFVVPGTCKAQTLSLVAEPGETTAELSVQIDAVRVVK